MGLGRLFGRAEAPPVLPRRPPPPRGHGALLTWGLQRIQNLRRAVRRAQPTRQGWIFLAAMVAVALAAMNTGNNLLYLVLAAMLSLVGVSSVLSEWSIRDLQVSRVIEQEVFSGQWAAGRWELRNPRRFSPAIRVRVEEVAAGLAHLHGEVAVEFPLVAAGRTAVADARWCFEGRGIHRIEVGGEAARQVIEEFPRSYLGYRVAADFYRLTKKWKQFDAVMIKLQQLNPVSVGLAFQKGVSARDRERDVVAARRWFSVALSRDARFTRASVHQMMTQDSYIEFERAFQAFRPSQTFQTFRLFRLFRLFFFILYS